MKIRPLDLIDFDEPVPVSAVYAPFIPMAVFNVMLGMMLAENTARRRPRGSTRIRVSIPEGMRVRIRCA